MNPAKKPTTADTRNSFKFLPSSLQLPHLAIRTSGQDGALDRAPLLKSKGKELSSYLYDPSVCHLLGVKSTFVKHIISF